MRFGIKLWSTNADLIGEASELVNSGVFQYVELTPLPGTDISPFLRRDLPYVIHATTENHGVNIGDPAKAEYNLRCIRECTRWADLLCADHLIVHPGFGRLSDAMRFLEQIDDRRVLIENMPAVGLHDEPMIGYDTAQVRQLTMGRFGLCLDVNHAIKAAFSMGMDYRLLLDQFLKMNPGIVHLSDGHVHHMKDEHLRIGDGDYDFSFIMGRLRLISTCGITIETPRTSGTLGEVIGDLERLLK